MSKRYDFKRKRYGWGWTPVTQRGWLLTGGLVLAIVVWGFITSPLVGVVPEYLVPVVLPLGAAALVLLFMWLIRDVSPKPKWRSGTRPGDNPDEDV